MNKLPRIGSRVRDPRTGVTGTVRSILATSGAGGRVDVVIAPDGQRSGTRAVTRMVALQDVEALH